MNSKLAGGAMIRLSEKVPKKQKLFGVSLHLCCTTYGKEKTQFLL